MSDHSHSGGAEMSRWALVNSEGELEGSDGDSHTSSDEVLEPLAEEREEQHHGHSDQDSRDVSSEYFELEQLMKKADAAAAIDKADAETNIPNETDCDTERDSSASVVDSLKKRDQRASVAEQSSEMLTVSCSEPQTSLQVVCRDKENVVPCDSRPVHLHQGRDSPVSVDSLLSLSSLSSVSATTTTTTSSSSDSDNEPDFVCLEKESVRDISTAEEANMTGSKAAGVLASGSAVSSGSSVGSGFDFLLGGGERSISHVLPLSSLQPHPQQTLQQGAPMPESRHLEEEQHQQGVPTEILLQQNPPVSLPQISPQQLLAVSCPQMEVEDAVFEQNADDRSVGLSHVEGSVEGQMEGESLERENSILAQGPDHDSLLTNNDHLHTVPSNILHRLLGKRKSLKWHMVRVTLLGLAFAVCIGLGFWIGTTWHLSELEKLAHQMQIQNTKCFDMVLNAEAAKKREMADKHYVQEQLKESQRQVEQLQMAISTYQDQLYEDRSVTDETAPLFEDISSEQHEGEGTGGNNAQPFGQVFTTAAGGSSGESHKTDTENVTILRQAVREEQQQTAKWRHLYLSLKENRKNKLNTSACLRYLRHHMNMSDLLHFITNVSGDSVGGIVDVQYLMSGVSQLQHGFLEALPSAWEGLSSAFSSTVGTFTSTTNKQSGATDKENDDTVKSKRFGDARGEADTAEEKCQGKSRCYTADEYGDGPELKIRDDRSEDKTDEGTEQEDITEEHIKTEEAESRDKQKFRWTLGIKDLWNKTRGALSQAGQKLQRTWKQVKVVSKRFLPGKDSIIGRVAAGVKKTVQKLSTKIQNKAARWFKKNGKNKNRKERRKNKKMFQSNSGEKDLHRREEKRWKIHKEGKKAGRRTRKDKTRNHTGNQGIKNEKKKMDSSRQETTSAGDDVRVKQDDRLKTDSFDSGGQRSKVQTHHHEKQQETVHREKAQSTRLLNNQPHEPEENGFDVLHPEDSSHEGKDSEKLYNKESHVTHSQQGKQDENNQHTDLHYQDDRHNLLGKHHHGDSLFKEHVSQSSSQDHSSTVDKAKAKFQLHARFQSLFSTVSSMSHLAFEAMDRKDFLQVLEEISDVSMRYLNYLEFDLPYSGVQWLDCQFFFWFNAQYHVYHEPAEECSRYLASWQTTLTKDLGKKELQASGSCNKADAAGNDGEDCQTHFHDMKREQDGYHEKSLHYRMFPKGQREDDHSVEKEASEEYPDTNKSTQEDNPTVEIPQAWYFHRADARNNLRSVEHKADWLFDRAAGRDETRQEEHSADWVFDRAAERGASRERDFNKPVYRHMEDDNHLSQGKEYQRHKAERERNEHQHGHKESRVFKRQRKGYRQKYGPATFCDTC